MRFHTHDRTPRPKMSKLLKALFLISGGLLGGFFLFFAVYASITIKSIAPALIVAEIPLLAVLILIGIRDMNRAYVEINGDSIDVVDYYCFVKRKKSVSIQEIARMEILSRGSRKMRGLAYPLCSYLVFWDREGKYLFKLFYTPETMQYFEQLLKGRPTP